MSVGHVQRAIEQAGIPSVSVYVKSFAHVAEFMSTPRTVVVSHPMGRPLGAPFDAERQRAVVGAALALLESAREPTHLELPDSYRPGPA